MSISALIIARNEENKIENTLSSLSFVDEIVVILDRSVDATKVISKKYTKKYILVLGNQKEKEEILVYRNVHLIGFLKLMQTRLLAIL